MKKIRVAFIGMAHVHVRNLPRDFSRYPDEMEVVGIADYPPYTEAERETRRKLNFPDNVELTLYDDYQKLLADDIDVAVITTDTKDHARAAEETLGMHIHTVVEKPMALDMEDARRMYRASKKSTAELIINWPIAWFPAFRKAKELVDAGAAGDVLRVHYRSPSTRGPYPLNRYTAEELSKLWWYKRECGGGSICDYAGYGCVLATWLTGKVAKKVYGLKKNFFLPFSDVEDYSVFTIDFGDSIGLIEGSWSTMNNGEIPTGPVIYGSEGVIVADRYDPEVKVYKDLIPYQPSPTPNEVYMTEPIPDNIARCVLDFIRQDQPLFEMVTAAFNMKVMAAFDAGRRSCETGNPEAAAEPFQF